MQKPFSRIFAVLMLGCLVACLSVILLLMRRGHGAGSDEAALSLLREAYAAINRSYVDKPDSGMLVRGMVDGMLLTLDPHSAYLPPEPYHEMEVQMSGIFGGIGIELGMKENRLTVIAPIEDTPAFRAGIQAGDHIWKVDGVVTRGMSIAAAVKRMRGARGTPVTLTIVRNGSSRPLVFRLVRDIIRIKSLTSRQLAPGYGYIRISQFQERTGSEFRQALRTLHAGAKGGLKGLVIDLRYNPGGLLESAIEVANCFIGDNARDTLIVSTKGRRADASHAYHATLGEKEPRYPVVVLMNGGSASASEIVAGALQDHRRALVMGLPSFGKGSVQSVFPLAGKGALKLTTALYYTPSGRSIQARGITPDREVGTAWPVAPAGGTQRDVREENLEHRLEGGKGKSGAMPEASGGVSPHMLRTEPDISRDYQLHRALELLRSLSMLKERGAVTVKP
jgi:carboxyl-terminal processing protease